MSNFQEEAIKFMEKIAKKAKLPGMTAVIVEKKCSFNYCYGMEDKKKKKNIEENSLFEIGSMSKAFTILGALILKNKGLFCLEDRVSKYIDKFHLVYCNEKYDCTIEDLIYHRTGIPFEQVHKIRPGDSDDSLATNCKLLIGQKVKFQPGTEYLYSSCNTDLLAYIIQVVTNMSYEEYMHKEVFSPLGLNHTYFNYEIDSKNSCFSKGYKYSFFKEREYTASIIRANAPAAYIISSIVDMERWLKINMGMVLVNEKYASVIEEMHVPRYKIEENTYLGAGWNINEDGVIWFRGNNPNYQSVILFDKTAKNGICILTNICTNTIYYIAENVFKVQRKSLISKYKVTPFKKLDILFSIADIVGGVLSGILLIRLLYFSSDFCFVPAKCVVWCIISIIVNFMLFIMPDHLADYSNLDWKVIKVWASESIYYFRYIIEILLIVGFLNSMV